MGYYNVRRQLNNIYDGYSRRRNGVTPKDLHHFTSKSKISVSKNNKFTNSRYLTFIESQLHNINKLRLRFRSLDKHRNTLKQILDKYAVIDTKINNINRVLHLNIQEPFIYDIDEENNTYQGSHLYSFSGSRFDYLLSRYNAVNTGNNGEKEVIRAIKFERDNPIQDVNLPDSYGNNNDYDSVISNRMNNQMDIVIVNCKGIFILEVKNYHASTFTVDSGGYIVAKSISGKKYRDGNVIDQSEKHRVAMEEFLRNRGISNVKIYPLIICANEYAKFDTHSTNARSQILKPRTIYYDFIDKKRKSMDDVQIKGRNITDDDKVTYISDLIKRYAGQETEKDFYEPIFTKGFVNEFCKIINYEQEIDKLNELANHISKGRLYNFSSSYSSNYDYSSHNRYNYKKSSYNHPYYKGSYYKQSYYHNSYRPYQYSYNRYPFDGSRHYMNRNFNSQRFSNSSSPRFRYSKYNSNYRYNNYKYNNDRNKYARRNSWRYNNYQNHWNRYKK